MAPIRNSISNISLRKNNFFVRRRFTRSFGDGEVDFVPHLPPEIVDIIFRQLSVNDLGKCLRVSKSWCSLANSDALWKPQCMKYGISSNEDKKFVKDARSYLCKWAQIWRSFRLSPSYSWRTCRSRTLEMERSGLYLKNACDGESLVFCTGSLITLRKATELGKNKHLLRLPLPADPSTSLAVDGKFIAVAKCNIVLIYKMGTLRYRCILGVSMDEDVIQKTRSSFKTFVRANLKDNSSSAVCILAFSKGCIWLREQGRYKTYVVNVHNEKVSRVETHFYRYITRAYIVSWSRRKIRVDNFSGKNILKLNRDINKARANNHILVTFGFTGTGVNYEQIMETWELSTGKRLLCLPRPKHAFFEIHPSQDILYQIEAGQDYVSSLCALTGSVLWTVSVPNVVDILEWCMRVVCARFLVLFQFKSSISPFHTLIYVYDTQNGDFLYKTDRPPGHLDHLSDNMIITKTSNKIFIRTFLPSVS